MYLTKEYYEFVKCGDGRTGADTILKYEVILPNFLRNSWDYYFNYFKKNYNISNNTSVNLP